MLLRFLTHDCPGADGHAPQDGARRWRLSFPLVDEDTLELHIGQECRDALREMFAKEDADDAEGK